MSATVVADVLIDGLQRSGVARLFGPAGGGPPTDLLDAARRHGLDVVGAEDAAAAAIMAAVTGELTGAPGAVLAGCAADVERALRGIAHARRDRAALIVVTAGPAGSGLPLASIVKARVGVEPASAARSIAHATRLALSAPRGPVHLDLAPGVAACAAVLAATPVRPGPLPPSDTVALDEAARRLAAAARPVIVAGAQCRWADAAAWLWPFAEAVPAPVLVTAKAKGVFPDRHPLHLGLWPDAARSAEVLLGLADLVVMLGVEAGEREGWTPGAPVLHVAEAAADDARDGFVAEVVGEIGLVLAELAPRLRGRVRADWDVAQLDQLKRDRPPRAEDSATGLTPARVAEIARELTESGTIAAVDAGRDMRAVAAAWEVTAPHELLASAGFTTTGFALPAAIAAQLVSSKRRVVCFTGEPGLAVAGPELASAVRWALPIVVVAVGSAPLHAIEGAGAGVAVAGAADEETYRHTLRRALDACAPTVVAARVRVAESTV